MKTKKPILYLFVILLISLSSVSAFSLNSFTQPDTIIQNIYDPQNLNRYSFERNNPYKYTDPSGNYISPFDALDYVSFADSVYSMYNEPSWENAGWLALDTVFVVLPGVGGAGALGKSAKYGDNIFDYVKGMFKSKKGAFKGLTKSSSKTKLPTKTPGGIEISKHAAERIVLGAEGRAPLKDLSKIDEVLIKGKIVSTDSVKKTTKYRLGKIDVVKSDTTGKIVTVINKVPK